MENLEKCMKLLFIVIFLPIAIYSQKSTIPSKWLSFENIQSNEKLHFKTVKDQITNLRDTIYGTYIVQKDGVYGKSLLLDGYSAYVFSKNVPLLSASISAEGWLAIGAYPFNFCPIAEQVSIENKGFSLGINHLGLPVFKVGTHDGLVQIEGKSKIPLRTWAHICGVYDQENITLYLNGEIVAQQKLQATFIQAKSAIFHSGRTTYPSMPEGALTVIGTKPMHHFFDGLIDEIKIWDRALTMEDLNTVENTIASINVPALEKRSLPTLPELNQFGAFYSDLKFYESWDNYWRTTDFPDVVVSLGKAAGHFVFWRGTNYIPHWVSENGVWYNNEFNETWSEYGCHEPMSDKRTQYSHVRIIENTPARCVVHWRYALNDNWYQIANIDSLSGWGDWTDEVYTIYPDGTAVRSQTLHSSNLSSNFEWHEGIIVMGQGQTPEDVLYPEALIMANMKGENHVFSWEKVGPNFQKKGTTYVKNKKDQWLTELPNANIQLINTRSLLKPFTIINPADEPIWDFYRTTSRDISIFPWWNHWPTSLSPSDGRHAMDSDRASHSSLTHVREWKSYKQTEYSETKLMLVGLTKEKASDLVSLAQSWSTPPKLTVIDETIIDIGYKPEEKAYYLECLTGKDDVLKFMLNSSMDVPLINPAFVILNWSNKEPILNINGKEVIDGNLYKYGTSTTSNGNNLILWINGEFTEPVIFNVSTNK